MELSGITWDSKISGDHGGRVTPVPIPNTEVKTASADGTWWATAWESRASPEFVSKGTERDLGPLFTCMQPVGRYGRRHPGGGIVSSKIGGQRIIA